jgi:drug/metabolite transporter (DMT)-like permease
VALAPPDPVPIRRYLLPVRSRPEIAIAAVAAFWGSIGLIVREVPEPATVIVFARVAIATVGLGIWMRWFRTPRTDEEGFFAHHPVRAGLQGVLLACHWVALFAAFQRAPVGTVVLVTYVAPVLVALVAPRLLGERAPRLVLVALVIAVVGSILVLGPGASGAPRSGIALALVAAVLLAVLIINAKLLSGHLDGVRLAFLQVAVATAVMFPVVALAGSGWPSARSLAWMVVLGLVHTAAALVVYFDALARIPATSAGVLAYLEPASGVLFAWWLLAERPSPAMVMGGALIMVAGLLVVLAGGDAGARTTTSVARYH